MDIFIGSVALVYIIPNYVSVSLAQCAVFK